MKKNTAIRLINAEELKKRWLFKEPKGRIYRDTVDTVPTFKATPCNFCKYYPPTAEEWKPCMKCPAETKKEEI